MCRYIGFCICERQLWSGKEDVETQYVNGSFVAGTSASSPGLPHHMILPVEMFSLGSWCSTRCRRCGTTTTSGSCPTSPPTHCPSYTLPWQGKLSIFSLWIGWKLNVENVYSFYLNVVIHHDPKFTCTYVLDMVNGNVNGIIFWKTSRILRNQEGWQKSWRKIHRDKKIFFFRLKHCIIAKFLLALGDFQCLFTNIS